MPKEYEDVEATLQHDTTPDASQQKRKWHAIDWIVGATFGLELLLIIGWSIAQVTGWNPDISSEHFAQFYFAWGLGFLSLGYIVLILWPIFKKDDDPRWFHARILSSGIVGGSYAFLLPVVMSLPEGSINSGGAAALRQAILLATGGLIALIALGETRRKNDNDKLKNDQEKEKNDREHLRQVRAERRERYTKAVEQLGDEKAPIRMGGVYTLVSLVDEWLDEESLSEDEKVKEGQAIINNLCAYIRSPFPLYARYYKLIRNEPGQAKTYLNGIESFYDDRSKLQAEIHIRLSIIKEIHDRLQGNDKRPWGIWSNFEYNFSGSAFFYYVNLTNSYYKKPVNFSNSAYIEKANFEGSIYESGANFSESIYRKETSFSTQEKNSYYKCNAKFKNSQYESDIYFTGSTYESDVIFLGSSYKGDVNFSNSTYHGKANFSESTYEDESDFSGSIYKKTTLFNKSIYKNKANFYGSTYIGEVDFRSSIYEKDVIFSNPKSRESRSIYRNSANFSNSLYQGKTDFSKSIYDSEVCFGGSIYAKLADFKMSVYGKDVIFSTSTSCSRYHREAHFAKSVYRGKADFSNSIYGKDVIFSNPDLLSTYKEEVDFSQSIYGGKAYFIESTYEEEVNFTGSIFSQGIYFTDEELMFMSCFLKESPKFYHCSLIYTNTLFSSFKNNLSVDIKEGHPLELNCNGLPIGCNFLTPSQESEFKDKFQKIEEVNEKILIEKYPEKKKDLVEHLKSIYSQLNMWRMEVTTVKLDDEAIKDIED